MACYKIVLVRHGESEWNKANKFTGWYDADLSELGVQEAKKAGQLLKENQLKFDVAYTSVLKRAIKTLYLVQEELDLHWIPVHRHWRLNERMYGGLQGLNKAETAAAHGEDQVKRGEKVLISAHGNSLRALVKYLDNVSETEIAELNIPTGIPLVYELDADLQPIKHYYLADQAEVNAAMAKVANQGKAK
ncbi:hypothetical protein EB796_009128 [Bugula neritina]|uniref:Phosphoglycerate mutase n=1 Tax=Bugula neritina TaxID=10212 RepID=A0A7J7K2T6_BUGNE|nr:hypothetical protein EB796_009128 [Bugula neritina]